MDGLPKGMIPNRDNVVYYDTEKRQLYYIEWRDGGNNDIAIKHYIPRNLDIY